MRARVFRVRAIVGPGAAQVGAATAACVALCVAQSACQRSAAPLTWETLAAGTYPTENTDSGTVTLVAGEYEDPANHVHISLPRRMVTRGDLDGDGTADAAVVLVTNTGGSGVFHDLCVVPNRGGAPGRIVSAFLGDRIQINSFSIESGQVVLDMVVQGPDDPFCCPTLHTVKRYRLDDGRLLETATTEE